jgi:hypothetical protein
MPKENGFYFDWVDFPVKEPTMEALDNYNWLRPDPPEYDAKLAEQARYLIFAPDASLAATRARQAVT